ncbi:MAG: hypothetical protein ACFB00_04305 [Parvularculaceae bacterium]
MAKARADIDTELQATRLAIYRALDDPDTFSDSLSTICRMVGSDGMFLNLPPAAGANLVSNAVSYKIDMDDIAKTQDDLGVADPWSVEYLKRYGWSAGHVVSGLELCRENEIRRSAWWPLVRKHKLTDVLMGTFSIKRPWGSTPQIAVATLHRYGDADPFDDAATSLMRELLPDIQRAASLLYRLNWGASKSKLQQKALDTLHEGVTVCDGRGEILFTNDMAERLLSSSAALGAKNGRMGLQWSYDEPIARRFDDVVSSGRAGEGVIFDERGSPYVVSLTPLAREAADAFAVPGGVVLMTIRDPHRNHAFCGQTLMDLFALTASEADVAIGVARGHGAKKIAAGRGVSVETVRKQIKHAMEKVGVHSQAALAARICAAGSTAIDAR